MVENYNVRASIIIKRKENGIGSPIVSLFMKLPIFAVQKEEKQKNPSSVFSTVS